MIGERDEAAKPDYILDLIHLGFVRQLWREWRSPIGPLEIYRDDATLALFFQSSLQHRAFLGQER